MNNETDQGCCGGECQAASEDRSSGARVFWGMVFVFALATVLYVSYAYGYWMTTREYATDTQQDANHCFERLDVTIRNNGTIAEVPLRNKCGRSFGTVEVQVKFYDGSGNRVGFVNGTHAAVGNGERILTRVKMPDPGAGVKAVSVGSITVTP